MDSMPNNKAIAKRRADCQQFVSATGRSFKRLRLDTTHNSVASAASFGSANYQSNSNSYEDEMLGNNYQGEGGQELRNANNLEERSAKSSFCHNKEEMNNSGAESEEGGSVGSSWVASLQSMGSNNNGMFRKNRQQQAQQKSLMMRVQSNQQPNNAVSAKYYASKNDDDDSNNNGSSDGYYNDDDVSLAAMTTAAVAPRKRRFNNSKLPSRAQMKKPLHLQQYGIEHHNNNNDGDDDLQVEELDMMNMKPSPNKLMNADNNINMPDPLLVAAQHAMVRGVVEQQQQQHPPPQPNHNNNNISSVLLIGDCCSSVTEEETSLAEDEASLSAISIGANTIMSALSGPGDGNTVVMGAPPPVLPAAAAAFVDTFKSSSATQQQHIGVPATLNSILGGLHKERVARRNSSFHSLGSDGCQTHDGSGRSLPNSGVVSGYHPQSMGMEMHQPPPPPPAAFVPKSTYTAAMHSHVEDEEMEDVAVEGSRASQNQQRSDGSLGQLSIGRGSGDMDRSASTNGGDRNNANSGREEEIPKWKRRVNLQSHSSLY